MKGYAVAIPGKTMDWMEKETPHIGALDALLKPIALAPCSSDVHNLELGRREPGIILGHEALGEVVEVGSEVKQIKVGDKVIVPAVTPQWGAKSSQNGYPQHCNRLFGGCILGSKDLDGTFAEYFKVPEADANLYPIPEGMSYKTALMLTDMANTGFYGSELAGVGFGDTVAIIGIGPVGLMALCGAELRGAGRIVAVGTRPKCVELARHYGASDIVSYKDGDIVEQINQLLGLNQVDCCVIAGGDENTLGQALNITRPGGTVANINYISTFGDIPIPAPAWGWGMCDKNVACGLCPGGRVRMERLSSMVLHGRFDPSLLITHEFHGLEALPQAFQMMRDKPKDLIKTIVYCD